MFITVWHFIYFLLSMEQWIGSGSWRQSSFACSFALPPPQFRTNNTYNYLQNRPDELLTKHLEISLYIGATYSLYEWCVCVWISWEAEIKPIFHSIYLKIFWNRTFWATHHPRPTHRAAASHWKGRRYQLNWYWFAYFFPSVSLKFNSPLFVLAEQLSNLLNPKWQNALYREKVTLTNTKSVAFYSGISTNE